MFYLVAKAWCDHEQEFAGPQAGISPLLADTIPRLLSPMRVRKLAAGGAWLQRRDRGQDVDIFSDYF